MNGSRSGWADFGSVVAGVVGGLLLPPALLVVGLWARVDGRPVFGLALDPVVLLALSVAAIRSRGVLLGTLVVTGWVVTLILAWMIYEFVRSWSNWQF
jgi:hypothetical protein